MRSRLAQNRSSPRCSAASSGRTRRRRLVASLWVHLCGGACSSSRGQNRSLGAPRHDKSVATEADFQCPLPSAYRSADPDEPRPVRPAGLAPAGRRTTKPKRVRHQKSARLTRKSRPAYRISTRLILPAVRSGQHGPQHGPNPPGDRHSQAILSVNADVMYQQDAPA